MLLRLTLTLLSAIFWVVSSTVTPPALAETYYLAPAGNDRAEGTFENPWKTLNKHVDYCGQCIRVQFGDTIKLMPGIYHNLREWLAGNTDARFQTSKLVGSGNLTIRAHDPTNPPVLTARIAALYTPSDPPSWISNMAGLVTYWKSSVPVWDLYAADLYSGYEQDKEDATPGAGIPWSEQAPAQGYEFIPRGSYQDPTTAEYVALVNYTSRHAEEPVDPLVSPWDDFVADSSLLVLDIDNQRTAPQYIGPGLFYDGTHLYIRLDPVEGRDGALAGPPAGTSPNSTSLAVFNLNDKLGMFTVMTDVVFQDIVFADMGKVQLSGNIQNVTFDRTQFHGAGSILLTIADEAEDVTIRNSLFDNRYPHETLFRSDIKFGNALDDFHVHALLIGSTSSGLIERLPKDITIEDNIITNTFFGITIKQGQHVRILRNEIVGAADDAILVQDKLHAVEIAHNYISGFSGISVIETPALDFLSDSFGPIDELDNPPGHVAGQTIYPLYVHHNTIVSENVLCGRITNAGTRLYEGLDLNLLDHDGDGTCSNRSFGSHNASQKAYAVYNNTFVTGSDVWMPFSYATTADGQIHPSLFFNNLAIQLNGDSGRLHARARIYDSLLWRQASSHNSFWVLVPDAQWTAKDDVLDFFGLGTRHGVMQTYNPQLAYDHAWYQMWDGPATVVSYQNLDAMRTDIGEVSPNQIWGRGFEQHSDQVNGFNDLRTYFYSGDFTPNDSAEDELQACGQAIDLSFSSNVLRIANHNQPIWFPEADQTGYRGRFKAVDEFGVPLEIGPCPTEVSLLPLGAILLGTPLLIVGVLALWSTGRARLLSNASPQ